MTYRPAIIKRKATCGLGSGAQHLAFLSMRHPHRIHAVGAPWAASPRGGETSMPQTGGTCPQSGIYANDCHARQIALSKGETFPPCSGCHRAATWRLVRPTR
jgi:hypothetical protein